MVALYILLGILLFLLLLCFVRLRLFLTYTDDARLRIKVLFYEKVLLPAEKKPKKQKPEKKAKKKPEPKPEEKKEEPKEKKPSYLQKLKDKKGMTGLISLFTDLAKIAGGALKRLFRHIVIKKLEVGIALNSGDAASTALNYGRVCSALYPAVNIIAAATVCKDYHVTVEPVFDDERETEFYADVYAYTRVGWVLLTALIAGVKLLIARIKL